MWNPHQLSYLSIFNLSVLMGRRLTYTNTTQWVLNLPALVEHSTEKEPASLCGDFFIDKVYIV